MPSQPIAAKCAQVRLCFRFKDEDGYMVDPTIDQLFATGPIAHDPHALTHDGSCQQDRTHLSGDVWRTRLRTDVARAYSTRFREAIIGDLIAFDAEDVLNDLGRPVGIVAVDRPFENVGHCVYSSLMT
jgi:hypothetical protein